MHPTAAIDPDASLGTGVDIGPYAVIEADVVIGDRCRIGAHTVIKRHTRLGAENAVHEHVVLGGAPQHLSFTPCTSYVKIGAGNVIREGVTVHRALHQGAATRIGDDNYLMAYAHVAHDCHVGHSVLIANNAMLGGHVEVGERAFVSGGAGIHQFCRVGRLAMVGFNSKVTQDCLPFVTTDGVPARARGLNTVGLKRAGIPPEERQALRRAYRLLLRSGLGLENALQRLRESESALVAELAAFVESSTRGICRKPGLEHRSHK
ncbi:MAG: acyl-ACP--UDP-N-acetylglucosamine O-acyltransferase [Gammaproteobacteria bacterium]|nr:acyl-ACP--UDP-N-acetylglucosamine O-acyltransferase [Gammaproteobacteria bacterium]NIR97508.1 acyl-ACP--UDP-N-acetylglucosamine O-acyltransferase [Gammaproteobacteria bacterium]NIT63146.1 acyl-ACP--UDP-N-acetylglucosamine O-acyltransferase [Gammaproteobacteria bacterium]NIV19265.1 acyl-ACP--UDP-N-acetylglucosamine O-acyltransferase [Gammaproteobacteria bacterium]NIX10255.1 acyl-ACP--UDP-N-acetylglucosamine O-acyltransferase [Gammaproteobacteria bacterium]